MPASEPEISSTDYPSSASESAPHTQKPKKRASVPPPTAQTGSKDGGDKKLIPPPPIIGPDGKELPRPVDAAGRPLPIYVDAERKPILDSNGKPIPLKFGDDGKPIPLPGHEPPPRPSGNPPKRGGDDNDKPVVIVEKDGKAKKVPAFLVWVAMVDIIIALAIAIFYGYKTHESYVEGKEDKPFLIATTVNIGFTAVSSVFPIMAVKRNSFGLVWPWIAIAVLVFVVQIGLGAYLGKFIENSIFGAFVYLTIRMLGVLVVVCLVGGEDSWNSDRAYVASSGSAYYPSGGMAYARGGPQTVVVHQPTVIPAYGYGYGYPYHGYYGSTTDAALLGFAAGSMLGGGYYGGYGYGGWGYDDYGWGGGWGYDDYW